MDCCQLALSTTDLPRTHWWYRRALGFVAGGERRQRGGAAFAAVPDLPEVQLDVWCLVGRQPFVQIEMIEFERPRMRARPSTWRRSDIGYSTVGVYVPDFDAALARIDRVGGRYTTDPVGPRGDRRVCLSDPDDTLLEVREAPMFAGESAVPVDRAALPAIASVSVTVRDLERALRFWIDVLGGSRLTADAVHTPAHEVMWGLEGAVRQTAVVRLGGVALELVQYATPPSRGRRAGDLLSDQGILNIALGSTNKEEFDETYAHAVARGFRGHMAPWTVPGVATVVYLADDDGTSVELLHVAPEALERMGFAPAAEALPQV